MTSNNTSFKSNQNYDYTTVPLTCIFFNHGKDRNYNRRSGNAISSCSVIPFIPIAYTFRVVKGLNILVYFQY